MSELGCFFFSLIALSETRTKHGESFVTNVDIPGYTFVSQPSLSNAGGVGLFLKNDLKYIVWQIEVPKSRFTYHTEGQFHFGFILFL